MVVDDHAAVAIENLAARRDDGQRFDAVALGQLVVDLRVANLEVPEAGDQEEKDGNRYVLEYGDAPSGELGVVAQSAL